MDIAASRGFVDLTAIWPGPVESALVVVDMRTPWRPAW